MAQVKNVTSITTEEYPTPASRPANSKLDNSKLSKVFRIKLPDWQEGLHQVMRDFKL